jgi:hypothetical protein
MWINVHNMSTRRRSKSQPPAQSGQEAAEILERLKQTVDVQTDAELASLLGVSPTALSNWRVRNSVPLGRLRPICKQFAIPLDYLLTGRLGIFDAAPLDTELLGYVFKLLARYGFISLPASPEPSYDPARRAAAEFLELQGRTRELFKHLVDSKNLTVDEAKRAIVARFKKGPQ